MKRKTSPADFADSTTLPKKKVRKSRAERRAERQATLPIHKRPIVCPPDRAGRHPLFRLGGLLARTLIIWLTSAGFTMFLSDAIQTGVSHPFILVITLITVALGMIFVHGGPVGKLVAGLLAAGSVAVPVMADPRMITDIPFSFVALYNAALARLYKVGYLAYEQFAVEITSTPTPAETLCTIGIGIIGMVFSVIFAACFARRVRLVFPAILTSSLLVVILTYNIYSKYESNLPIVLVMVSFASILVMAAYDRLYSEKNKNQYDTQHKLFADTDRPPMPAAYTDAKSRRKARRASRAELRAKRRTHTATVADELDEYFNTDKKKKKASAGKSAEEKKAEKRAHREIMREVRRVRRYDRTVAQSRFAMSGYAGVAVLLACLLTIALPALLIQERSRPIEFIDEKLTFARDYVTALLQGDDDALDRLEYEADADNFKPHSTALEQLEFTGKQIFYIQTRYATNFYLRGWIGTDYIDGAWVADYDLDTYQSLFGKELSPAEEMRYQFYHYMAPSLVDDRDPDDGIAYPDYYLNRFGSNLQYGFVSTLVAMRRVNSPSTLAYFPASFATRYGLLQFPAEGATVLEAHDLTYVNYYDGLYTGRNLHESGLEYATIAYAPVMTNSYWIENQATLQTAYNLQKEAMLVNNSGGKLTLNIYEDPTTGLVIHTYTKKENKTETTWRFYHEQSSRSGTMVTVMTDVGMLQIIMDGSHPIDAVLNGDVSIRVESGEGGTISSFYMTETYDKNMTDAERVELRNYLSTEQSYADFVYKTYLGTSGSEALRELAATIRAQAHTEEEQTAYYETIPDDPETPEDDSYIYEKKVIVNVPADVSLAAVRNSTTADAYVQRDLLVRNVIDYVIDEMGCTYTITPDLTRVDASLDGVENFLFNTQEGYCVQFASAATLLLREMGIPARYAEGYIASDLRKQAGADFVYSGYVRDYQAHAWVEVYFDGIGWIQYETTPQYYIGMYGADNTAADTPITPVLPEESETRPEETETNAPILDDTDTEPEETESLGEDDATAAAITRGSLIAMGVLLVIAAVGVLLYLIISRARAAEDHRQSIATQVLEPGFGTHTAEADRREMALELTDAVMDLLAAFDLSPAPGEFTEAYAARLTAELAPAKERPVKPTEPLPDVAAAFFGVASEEFGHGMSIEEMKALAALYLYLHREVRRRLTLGERLRLRYIKRKI